MNSVEYTDPVKKLLTLGTRPSAREEWPDYRELGLGREQIPELIRMLTDEELHFAPSHSPEVWAPVHAWRSLGQLRAVEAMEPLLAQLRRIDEEHDDAVGEEFPSVFGMIGVEAVPLLGNYLRSHQHGIFARVCAVHALAIIGTEHPEVRDRCVQLLTEQLAEHDLNAPIFNGFLVNYLVDLRALESMDAIREAYANERVDLFVLGDVEDVEILLGLRTERSTPAPEPDWLVEAMRKQALEAAHSEGKPPVTSSSSKIGRNDPCPCGSGKKYKVCCRP